MREILESERLLLRPPCESDLAAMVPLANDFGVARNLATMPYPYTRAIGEAWLVKAAQRRASGVGYSFAIIRNTDRAFLGGAGIHPEREFELGYWLGRPFWGNGYATEAAALIVRFTFDELGTESIVAGWYDGNEASQRVLEKLGFVPDGEEVRECLARSELVRSHKLLLTKTAFATAVVANAL